MIPRDMPSPPVERLSIRASMAIGVAVTLALWVYTGYSFTSRLAEVERQAAEVAARYLRAQELLTTVRTQVLVASVRVRDAVLNPDPAARPAYREQVTTSHAAIQAALAAYVPVVRPDDGRAQIERLRREVDEFRATALTVLSADAAPAPADIRELLNSRVVPRREAAVRISEEVQALNRAAFLQQQAELAAIHRTAEEQSLRRLGWALAVSIGVLLLAGLYAGRLEGRLRAQNGRSALLSRELQEATMRLMHAQEDERRTVARELHDEVGQVLTAVKVELSLAEREMAARGVSPAPLIEAQTMTAAAIRTVRDITQLLHPAVLDDLGLVAATDALLRGLARRHQVAVRFTHRGLTARLAPAIEVAAYRIVQEGLTNVARHSGATACEVDVRLEAGLLIIDVVDDGSGLDQARARTDGLGLIGIRERIAELGGQFMLTSAPGAGTRLHAELPIGLPRRQEAAIA